MRKVYFAGGSHPKAERHLAFRESERMLQTVVLEDAGVWALVRSDTTVVFERSLFPVRSLCEEKAGGAAAASASRSMMMKVSKDERLIRE